VGGRSGDFITLTYDPTKTSGLVKAGSSQDCPVVMTEGTELSGGVYTDGSVIRTMVLSPMFRSLVTYSSGQPSSRGRDINSKLECLV